MRSLPRREVLEPRGSVSTDPPPLVVAELPRAGLWATLRRLVHWSGLGVRFLAGTAGDLLLRRDEPARRGRRLRRLLERSGGTFLKLGQQLALRVDLFPPAFCRELSGLLDDVPPFPVEDAIRRVEQEIGRPLEEVFRAFDPEPIGAASIACVYQAELRDGSRVAVKVRRPGIVEAFAADRRALAWTVRVLELATLVRPGTVGRFVEDLEAMFAEELDFRREARNTDLFRVGVREAGLAYLSAPQVWFDLSGREVLVTEFVSGVWLWEVLAAVESDDSEDLEVLRRLDIDPRLVGRRLFETCLFGIFENLIFHADPHPANVVVQPGNRITLIDFGSCGSYSQRQLAILRQFYVCQADGDVGGMVRCAFELLEPLPPVDVDAMMRRAEEVFGESMRAIRSSGSQWWERTSANVWLNFLSLARDYELRVDTDVLRMIRSSLLYDTLAARLYPRLDIYAEYARFRERMARAARRRWSDRVRRWAQDGPDPTTYLKLEELGDLAQRTAYRLRRAIDAPTYRFSLLAGKVFFALSTTLQAAAFVLVGLLFGMAGVGVSARLDGRAEGVGVAATLVLSNPIFQVAVGLVAWATLRRILTRFGDREV